MHSDAKMPQYQNPTQNTFPVDAAAASALRRDYWDAVTVDCNLTPCQINSRDDDMMIMFLGTRH